MTFQLQVVILSILENHPQIVACMPTCFRNKE